MSALDDLLDVAALEGVSADLTEAARAELATLRADVANGRAKEREYVRAVVVDTISKARVRGDHVLFGDEYVRGMEVLLKSIDTEAERDE